MGEHRCQKGLSRGAVRAQVAMGGVAASLVWSLSLAQTSPPAAGQAADAAAGGFIDEIIVTARRREESVQTVPISLAVISAQSLEKQSLFSLRDAGNTVPNLAISSHAAQGTSAPVIMLRGVGQLQADLSNDPGVGIYVDGVYIGRNQGIDFNLLDLEQIEVLRGPQGTLFGRNTTGGALNITTKRPTQEFGGTVGVRLGNYDRRDVDAQINLPLTDQLAARISAGYRSEDGYGSRLDYATGRKTGEYGDTNRGSTRGQLLWTPGDAYEMRAIVDWSKTDQSASTRSLRALNPSGIIDQLNGLSDIPFDENMLTSNEFNNYATGPNFDEEEGLGAAVIQTWQPDGDTLQSVKSITSYRKVSTHVGVDFDGSPILILDSTYDVRQKQYAQEFQFNGASLQKRLDWTLGLYFFREDASFRQESPVLPEFFLAGGPDIGFVVPSEQRTTSYAAYGQGSYHLTDRLTLTAGLRYTVDKKELGREKYSYYSHAVVIPHQSFEEDWGALTPHADLAFRITPDVLTYVSVSEGFRSGGFNSNPTTAADTAPFDPEYLWTYEAGLKSEWLERRVKLNAAVFHSKYEDMQFSVNTVLPNGSPVKIYRNAGSATIDGFELEATLQPVDSLTFNLGVGYTDATYTNLDASSGVLKGSRFPGTPEWSVSSALEYQADIGANAALSARVDYTWKSSLLMELVPAVGPDPTPRQDAYGLLDARVALSSARSTWSAGVFGKNLTDERYMTAAHDWGGLGYKDSVWATPRQYGVFLSYDF